MSILSELKKLTGKQNAKVVSEALPDSIGGGGLSAVYLVENPLGPDSYGLYFLDTETGNLGAPFTFEDAKKYCSGGSDPSIIILNTALIACTLGIVTDLQWPARLASINFGIVDPSLGFIMNYTYYEYKAGNLVANSDGAMVRFDDK